MLRFCRSTLALAALALPLTAQAQAPDVEPVITVAGEDFLTWGDYVTSPLFESLGLRCQLPPRDPSIQHLLPPSDCSAFSTNFLPEYEPANLPVITIPVVVHVLRSNSGAGNVSDALIQSQIDILNEDFGALTGTPGQSGVDTRIRFELATVDPSGSPTTGITRTNNTTWFNDNGNYWDTLAWDPDVYLNIYTNQASGALGYVPCLPQCGGGFVGSNSDRVVCLWSSFGRNAPIGPPYNQGRTATHEVGHYLGLEHTFSGGCAPASSCSSNGDMICDTNPESSPTFGCPSSRTTCGFPAPFDNYMDYTNDVCMERFTPQQANRMRCTLLNWRPDLGTTCATVASTTTRTGTNLSAYFVDPPVLGQPVTFNVVAAGYDNATLFIYREPLNLDLGNGQELLVDTTSELILALNLPGLPFAQSTQTVPSNPNLCGLMAYSQVILTGPNNGGPVYQMTNAVDLVLGTQ